MDLDDLASELALIEESRDVAMVDASAAASVYGTFPSGVVNFTGGACKDVQLEKGVRGGIGEKQARKTLLRVKSRGATNVQLTIEFYISGSPRGLRATWATSDIKCIHVESGGTIVTVHAKCQPAITEQQPFAVDKPKKKGDKREMVGRCRLTA